MIIEAFRNREIVAPERQILVFHEVEPDGSRMILASKKNMLLTTGEEVRTNYKDFPMVALIKKDGTVIVDYSCCGMGEIFTNREQMLQDLNCALSAVGIPEIS